MPKDGQSSGHQPTPTPAGVLPERYARPHQQAPQIPSQIDPRGVYAPQNGNSVHTLPRYTSSEATLPPRYTSAEAPPPFASIPAGPAAGLRTGSAPLPQDQQSVPDGVPVRQGYSSLPAIGQPPLVVTGSVLGGPIVESPTAIDNPWAPAINQRVPAQPGSAPPSNTSYTTARTNSYHSAHSHQPSNSSTSKGAGPRP